MKFSILFLVFVLTGCTNLSIDSAEDKKGTVAGLEGGILFYNGSITSAANNTLFETFNNSEVKPKRLIITSPGGEIRVGMELGRWVREHNLDVEVEELCASACANYVFTAGHFKYLNKNSVLIWHGSAWQEDISIEEAYQAKLDKYLAEMRAMESRLFFHLKVDNLLCLYGQSFYGFTDYVKEIFGIGTVGFDYSLADLQKFGLNNIVLIDNEWDWRKYKPKKSYKVKRIVVSDNYQFTLNRFEI